jgi:rhodanese-related sulfurtransferase
MMRLLSLILLPALAVALAGCGGSGIEGRGPAACADAKELVAKAKAGVDQIDIEEFQTLMDSDEYFTIIDVREADEFDEGSIPGAINIPRGILESKIADSRYWDSEGLFVPEKDEAMIVYGHKIDRGVLAAETLVKLGYSNVRHLYGGWVVWTEGPEAVEVEEVIEEGGCGG